MAFAPVGPEASFFDAVDRHRASLLAVWKKDTGETPAGATCVASRFDDSVGLQMIPRCTTRKIKSDSLKSVKKFVSWACHSPECMLVSVDLPFDRDIYYTDSQLFGNQAAVDRIIDDISCMLKVPRRSLHVLSTSKGLIAGNLRYMEEDGTQVQCAGSARVQVWHSTSVEVRGQRSEDHFQKQFLPSTMRSWDQTQVIRPVWQVLSPAEPVRSNPETLTPTTDRRYAKFLLIVEKDATFQRLLDDNFCSRVSPCIMVTGKGVPDLNTRLLVKKLWDNFQIPVFTLVDADPYGIEIMCVYKYGSMVSTEERSAGSSASTHCKAFQNALGDERSPCLLTPTISLSRPSDGLVSFLLMLKVLNIPTESLIPLTKHDQMKLDSLLRRPYITYQPCWKKEMEMMAASKMKAEIQALTLLSSDYLSRVYLPNKLRFGGWI
ncbi:Meiotic recombination protein SPO11 [Apodemus speciosus]|uniref:DNA topoisomerase (ATP-hydrolyzing) n=1 Tax=Apodemus speciosus TaxID=105296 RepID=A0ABQ0EJU5_APOSI